MCILEKKGTLCQIPAETSAAVIALWEISVHVGLLQMGRPGRVTQHFSGPLLCTDLPLSLSLSHSVNNPWLGERERKKEHGRDRARSVL